MSLSSCLLTKKYGTGHTNMVKSQIINVPEHCFTFSHRFRGSISHVPGGPIGPDGPGGPRGPGIDGQLRLLVQS